MIRKRELGIGHRGRKDKLNSSIFLTPNSSLLTPNSQFVTFAFI